MKTQKFFWLRLQWRIQGEGKSGHGPPSKLAMEFGPPSGTERVMITLWICGKGRTLAPRTDVEYGFGPPTEKCHIQTLKKVDD